MSDTFNNYLHWAWKRKAELTNIIIQRTNFTVHQGPFKGTRILPKAAWADGDVVGKLLGLYECELFDAVEEVIAAKPDLVINVGAADGFYGIGLGRRIGPECQIVLIDVVKESVDISRENARLNGINKIQFSTESSTESLGRYLEKYSRPFIFMDCEGFEEDLLVLDKIPELSKTSMIVESHDVWRPGLTEKLTERFKDTHMIKVISQGAKNPYMDITHDLCDYDKILLCCEGRPMTSTWLYMVPKNEL